MGSSILRAHALAIVFMTATCWAQTTRESIVASIRGADVIERYDQAGQFRSVPLRRSLSAEEARALASCFPELGQVPAPLTGSATYEPMRFEIRFTMEGAEPQVVYVTPGIQRWWDDLKVYPIDPRFRLTVNGLTTGGKEDRSLLPSSPVVRVEISDYFDGYGRPRGAPLKAVVEGELAAATAAEFPELGMHREPRLSTGSVSRMTVTFIRENGQKHTVGVFERTGETWRWSEDGSTWSMRPSAVSFLLSACGDALRAAATQPATRESGN